MFRNEYQRKYLTIFYSSSPSPLEIWNVEVKYGCTRRVMDRKINALVFEIFGNNISTTFITCPKTPKESLGIYMPIMTIQVQNVMKFFTLEITIKDESNARRRLRFSNIHKSFRVKPFFTVCPFSMKPGWNEISFDLADLTKSFYCSRFMEVVRVQVNANCRLKRIYFSDENLKDTEIPDDYRLVKPQKKARRKFTPGKKKPITSMEKDKSIDENDPQETEEFHISETASIVDSATYIFPEGEVSKKAKPRRRLEINLQNGINDEEDKTTDEHDSESENEEEFENEADEEGDSDKLEF